MLSRKSRAPKPDPRPTAAEDCDACGAPVGVKHELSCDTVTPEQVAAYLDQAAAEPTP